MTADSELRIEQLNDRELGQWKLAQQTIDGAAMAVGAIGVMPLPGEPNLPYAFSIGLLDLIGFELLVVGITFPESGHLLNGIARRTLLEGVPLRYGLEVDGVVEPPQTLVVVPVPPSKWETYPTEVAKVWWYVRRGRPRSPVPVAQVVYPDLDMHWPWERAYRLEVQPYLGMPGVDPRH